MLDQAAIDQMITQLDGMHARLYNDLYEREHHDDEDISNSPVVDYVTDAKRSVSNLITDLYRMKDSL